MITGEITITRGEGCDCARCQNAPSTGSWRRRWQLVFPDAAAVLAFIAAHGECVVTVGPDTVAIEIYNDYRE